MIWNLTLCQSSGSSISRQSSKNFWGFSREFAIFSLKSGSFSKYLYNRRMLLCYFRFLRPGRRELLSRKLSLHSIFGKGSRCLKNQNNHWNCLSCLIFASWGETRLAPKIANRAQTSLARITLSLTTCSFIIVSTFKYN